MKFGWELKVVFDADTSTLLGFWQWSLFFFSPVFIKERLKREFIVQHLALLSLVVMSIRCPSTYMGKWRRWQNHCQGICRSMQSGNRWEHQCEISGLEAQWLCGSLQWSLKDQEGAQLGCGTRRLERKFGKLPGNSTLGTEIVTLLHLSDLISTLIPHPNWSKAQHPFLILLKELRLAANSKETLGTCTCYLSV